MFHIVTSAVILTTEAAQVLGVSKATIQRWAKSGRLEPVGKGEGLRGALIFRRSDVEALAAELDEGAA